MARERSSLLELLQQLNDIHSHLLKVEQQHASLLEKVHPRYQPSARNLLHYLALRSFDLRQLQEELSELGLSSISSSEGYTLANIANIRKILAVLSGVALPDMAKGDLLGYRHSRELLRQHGQELFGALPIHQHSHIMVTLPSEAATNYELVEGLLQAGMDIARINLSHDDVEAWQAMIGHLRQATQTLEKTCQLYFDLAGPKIRTGAVKLKKNEKKKPVDYLLLFEGDTLIVHQEAVEGRNATLKKSGNAKKPARISMSLPSAFADVQPGERILFDDGKLGGVIREVQEDRFVVQITQANIKGTKLRAEKGINLPDTQLRLPSLTADDEANLPFVAAHADIVGYSFVRKPEDVAALQARLSAQGAEGIGLVLKIENEEAFRNLPRLLLTAMRTTNVGVMIARGDLAVEVGFERIAEVQEEILWICEAAHIPVIWATQVLESLAKKGTASRAEITDAAMAVRAECVMLNKGPYIVKALQTLQNVLHRMSAHQVKKKGAMRPLQLAKRFLEEEGS